MSPRREARGVVTPELHEPIRLVAELPARRLRDRLERLELDPAALVPPRAGDMAEDPLTHRGPSLVGATPVPRKAFGTLAGVVGRSTRL